MRFWLKWLNPRTGEKYKIGMLTKENDMYCFEFEKEGLKKAEEAGFKRILEFPIVDKKYCSKQLFHTFAQRIPQEHRRDTQEILKKFGMDRYDELELLRRTKGELLTDHLSVEEE